MSEPLDPAAIRQAIDDLIAVGRQRMNDATEGGRALRPSEVEWLSGEELARLDDLQHRLPREVLRADAAERVARKRAARVAGKLPRTISLNDGPRAFPRTMIGNRPNRRGGVSLSTVRSLAIDAFLLAIENLCAEHGLGLCAGMNGEGFAVFRLGCPGTQWLETETGEKLSFQSPSTNPSACICYHTCADDPATACSLSGDFHVHAGERCPSHPDAPGDW